MTQRFMTLMALLTAAFLSFATAQTSVSLAGIIQSEDPLPDNTRVAVFQVDADGIWGRELVTVDHIANTFSLTLDVHDVDGLIPFRSGAVLLPGLQNEYRISPEDTNFVLGRMNMYVDSNDNGMFDRQTDSVFLGLLSLEEPIGFYNILYVDREATLTASGADLTLTPGWNIFTVRFPGDNAPPLYEIVTNVQDVILDVFLAE